MMTQAIAGFDQMTRSWLRHGIPLATVAGTVLSGCAAPVDDPSLVVRQDSGGVEIVEAQRPLWGDSSLWRIDPEPLVDLTTSGSGENHEFGQVTGMARFADGSVVVADGLEQHIRLYSPQGGLVATAGREGEGPGEFSGGIEEMLVAAGDSVWVIDWDGRVSLFGPDLVLDRTFSTSGLGAVPQAIHDLADGFMAVELVLPFTTSDEAGTVRTPRILWRLNTEGTALDSIGSTVGNEQYLAATSDGDLQSTTPLFPKRTQITTNDGALFVGTAESMEAEEWTAEGQLARILRIPDYPLALSAAVLQAERDSLLSRRSSPLSREVAERTPASGTRPAYGSMIVDPTGAVWLRHYAGRSERSYPQRWLVLAADGTWLGTVVAPDRFRIVDIETDVVLGVWYDELNVSQPQVLRLERR